MRNPHRYRERFTTNFSNFNMRFDEKVIDPYHQDFGRTETVWQSSDPWEWRSPSESMTDSVGYRDRDNPLQQNKSRETPGRVVGSLSFNHGGDVFEPWFKSHRRTEYYDGPFSAFPILTQYDEEKDIEFVTKAAAHTNPSRPHAQSLAFLAELRDLPGLFKTTGETMSKYGANEYLKFQYGWSPLIKDLRNFFRIANKLQRRMDTVRRLNQNGVLKRQYRPKPEDGISRDEESYEGPYGAISSGIYGSYGRQWNCVSRTERVTERWADTYWVADMPNSLFPPGGDTEMARVNNMLWGRQIDGAQLWQAMPWSWLIDWTSNCSEFIQSQNNVIGAKLDRITLMKRTSLYTITELQPPDLDLGPWTEPTYSPGMIVPATREQVIQERILDLMPEAIVTNEFGSILDSSFKVSILTALGIQRFKR